jgi:branched-chain amino acid aminotransferase
MISEGRGAGTGIRRRAGRILLRRGQATAARGTLAGMRAHVNVNGRITDAAHAEISIFDHGFLYGEGVYETLRTYGGEPFLWDRHLQRLRTSAAMILLDVPFGDDEFLRRSLDTVAAAGLGAQPDGSIRESYIRILLTRGIGELSYDPKATPVPSVVIIVKEHLDPPAKAFAEGVPVVMVDVVRNHPRSLNPLIKSNNLLNNALGMQQALRKGGVEGVFRNHRGELTECAQSNLFVVKDGVVKTPPLEAGLLAGITRAFVFEVGASCGVPVVEAVLHDADLTGADEAFYTSTTKELMPITRVDGAPVGTGRPGPVTQTLLAEFRRMAWAQVKGAAHARP